MTKDKTRKAPATGHSVERDQVLAFRLTGHNLLGKLPRASILRAAGACGLQNTPPGSAALALNARVANLAPDAVDGALIKTKTLLQAWSLRASPRVFPTSDAATYSLGLLPTDDASIRSFIRGAEPALDKIGIRALEVVELVAAGLVQELDGCSLTKDDLGIQIAAHVRPHLTAQQRAAWQSPSLYAPGQTLGESVVRFVLPLLALRGLCCHADRRENQAYIARTDRWLGTPLPEVDRDDARAELVRRYLHCYGPSTIEGLAEWAGISATQAAKAWGLIEQELVEIDFERHQTWLLHRDLASLSSPGTPRGVRFLPPHDPFLELRDRETLVLDKRIQRAVWRTVGNPGVLLVDGQFGGIWRPEKKGKRLQVTVEGCSSFSKAQRGQVMAEAATLAPFKNCASVEIRFVRAA